MERKIEGLLFQPYVPENYYSFDNKYGKLLILGESYYFGEDDADCIDETESQESKGNTSTNEVATEILKQFLYKNQDIPFYRNIGLLFNPEDKYEIWHNVAFANVIQDSMVYPEDQPTDEQFATATNAIWLLINNLKPNRILVCSQRIWKDWFPEEDCQKIGCIQAGKRKSNIWRYFYSGGFCDAIAINHPSKYFPRKQFEPLVKKFIKGD